MITSSDARVIYSDLQWPTVTYSDSKVTYIDPTQESGIRERISTIHHL